MTKVERIKKLLKLKPINWFCPCCWEKHKMNGQIHGMHERCSCDCGEVKVEIEGDYVHCTVIPPSSSCDITFRGKLKIDDIEEISYDEEIVLRMRYKIYEGENEIDIWSLEKRCRDCSGYTQCKKMKIFYNHRMIALSFSYDYHEYYNFDNEMRREEELAKRKAEEEAQRKAEEEAQRKAELAKRKAEEEAHRKAELAKREAEEEAQRKVAELESKEKIKNVPKYEELVKKLILFSTKYLCPHCGEWHDIKKTIKLDDKEFSQGNVLHCPKLSEYKGEEKYTIVFAETQLFVLTNGPCNAAKFNVKKLVDYKNMDISPINKTIEFSMLFRPACPIGLPYCEPCSAKEFCYIRRLANKRGNNEEIPELEIKLGFRVSAIDYDYLVHMHTNPHAEEKEMVVRKLCNLKPTRYVCPHCHKWHEWLGSSECYLNYYNADTNRRLLVGCQNMYIPYHRYTMYIDNKKLYMYEELMDYSKKIYEKISSIVVPLLHFELDKTNPQIYDEKSSIKFEFDKAEYDAIVQPYFAELEKANN